MRIPTALTALIGQLNPVHLAGIDKQMWTPPYDAFERLESPHAIISLPYLADVARESIRHLGTLSLRRLEEATAEKLGLRYFPATRGALVNITFVSRVCEIMEPEVLAQNIEPELLKKGMLGAATYLGHSRFQACLEGRAIACFWAGIGAALEAKAGDLTAHTLMGSARDNNRFTASLQQSGVLASLKKDPLLKPLLEAHFGASSPMQETV